MILQTKINYYRLLLVFLLFLSLPSTFAKYENNYISNSTTPSYKFDKHMGYIAFSNQTIQVTKTYSNNSLIFEAVYVFDEYGRRNSILGKNGKHIVLFGGSRTFGEGMNENQTLQYFLSRMYNHTIYNYALPGYGTQQMLAHIERRNFENEINENQGIAIYHFLPSHFGRVIGDMQTMSWQVYDMPYFYLEKENLKRGGTFRSDRPLLNGIYRIISKLNSIPGVQINYPIPRKKHAVLTFKIIERSKSLYESNFNRTFYVLAPSSIYDNSRGRHLVYLLNNSNIPLLIYPCADFKNFRIPGDGHPSEEQYSLLANFLKDSSIIYDN